VVMMGKEHVGGVEGTAAFFVSGERDDQVAVGLKAFFLVGDEVGEPDSSLCLVVAGAAAVKVAVLLDELEGVHGPVFALGFDNVDMRKEENGLAGTGAVIAHHDVVLGGFGAADEDVGVRKAGGLEACGGGFGDGSGRAGGEAGLHLDHLFVDFAGELFFGIGARGLRV